MPEQLLQHVPMLLFRTDPAGVVTFVGGDTPSFCTDYAQRALGESLLGGRPEFPELGAWLRRASTGEQVETAGWMGDRWIYARLVPLRDADGAFNGVAGYLRDQTERKRAEEKVARQTTRLELLKRASDAFVAANRDLSEVLDTVVRLVSETIGDFCTVFLLSDDREWLEIAAVNATDADALAFGKQVTSTRRLRVGDGYNGMVAQTGKPIFLPSIPDDAAFRARSQVWDRFVERHRIGGLIAYPLEGRERIVGTLCLTRLGHAGYDEEDLALVGDLAHRASLAIENAKLYRDLQEAVRIRDEFLSIASHELKTPLTSLLLAGQSLERALRRHPIEEATLIRRALAVSDRQGKRLNRLIDDLLDLSRIGAGRLTLDRKKWDMSELVDGTIAHLQPEMERSGSKLVLKLDHGVTGMWDRFRLEQAISNLLSNAIKFGRGEPIEVRAELLPTGVARLSVRDHGHGIPRELHETIFRRFERASNAEGIGGLGLGLYIVRGVVEAHEGKILLESTPGDGATFILELPRMLPVSEIDGERLGG